MNSRQPDGARPALPAMALSWLADPNCRILDFETTGLKGYAVECAVIDMSGAELFNERFWPDAPMEPGAERTHGISLESLRGEPRFRQRLEPLGAAIADKRVIAFNADFDRSVFERELVRIGSFGIGVKPAEWLCAMHLYSEWVGEPGDERYRGEYRWQRLPAGDHSALGDARAALGCIRKVAEGAR